MERTAVISEDKVYRYVLERWWNGADHPDPLVFCMLNPSTADAESDDATIRRCIGFAKREGKNGIVVVNAYAFRTSSTKFLRAEAERGVDVEGPQNAQRVETQVRRWGHVVIAWGQAGVTEEMWYSLTDRFKTMGVKILHLGKTKHGKPRHPLYVRSDQPLIEYATN